MHDGEGDNSPSGLTEWTEVCFHCRYDLRGTTGDICPECGKLIRQRIIRFREAPLLHSAAASLADNGIQFRVIDELAASAGFNIWAGGRLNSSLAALIISQEDYTRARRIIEESAVAAPRSLVDPHEPVCPRCAGPLDPQTDQACTKCGCLIEWVDVEAVSQQPSTGRPAPQAGARERGLTRSRLLVILLAIPAALVGGLVFATSMRWFLGPEELLFAVVMAIGLFIVCTLACGLRRKYALEANAVQLPAGPPVRPIVDRAEPICPRCRAELDVNGPGICPECGTPFQWVDIDVPDIHPPRRCCANCRYDLTGNTSGQCPECGETIECDPYELVEAATRSLEPAEEEPAAETTLWQDVAPLLAIVLGLILGIVLAVWLGQALKLKDPGMIVFSGWIILIVSALVVVEFNLRRRAIRERRQRREEIDHQRAAAFRSAARPEADAGAQEDQKPRTLPSRPAAFLSVALAIIVIVAAVGLIEALADFWFPALEWMLVLAGFVGCIWLVQRCVGNK